MEYFVLLNYLQCSYQICKFLDLVTYLDFSKSLLHVHTIHMRLADYNYSYRWYNYRHNHTISISCNIPSLSRDGNFK